MIKVVDKPDYLMFYQFVLIRFKYKLLLRVLANLNHTIYTLLTTLLILIVLPCGIHLLFLVKMILIIITRVNSFYSLIIICCNLTFRNNFRAK